MNCMLDPFLYFNLGSLLLLFTKRILSAHNDLPQGTLPLCLNVKPKCLCSGPYPTCRWLQEGRNKHTPSPGWPFQETLARVMGFLLYSITSPALCSMKEPGTETPIRWLFWDISLPSFHSASFLIEVIFLASTPRLQFIGLQRSQQSKHGLSTKLADGLKSHHWFKLLWLSQTRLQPPRDLPMLLSHQGPFNFP